MSQLGRDTSTSVCHGIIVEYMCRREERQSTIYDENDISYKEGKKRTKHRAKEGEIRIRPSNAGMIAAFQLWNLINP